jgi:D-glycero-D-manno-heptose 1,7-bisphosphate phosphatase
MPRAVFFDRDGVLNSAVLRGERTYAPLRLEDFEIDPSAADAVKRVQDVGLETVIVTNQPELSVGTLDPLVLDAMHEQIKLSLGIHNFYVCPHTSDAGCNCHKPAPGLIYEASRALGIDTSASYMVGDRWRDVGAGKAADCTTILIRRGYSYAGSPTEFSVEPDNSVDSLEEAVDAILEYDRTHNLR